MNTQTKTDTDQKILARIKKCLALSKSTNPNEAAIAMRQAHALMSKHGISAHEVTMADIGETTTPSKTMSRDKPAHWESRLAALVGKAFGCKILLQRTVLPKGFGVTNKGKYMFVGLKHNAEVAAYTASVLIRKCRAARKNWLEETFRATPVDVIGIKAKKTRLGDMFAEGWVEQIGGLVSDFANPPEIEGAMQRHIDNRVRSGIAPTREIKGMGDADYAAAAFGMKAAKKERLHRPMEAESPPLSLSATIPETVNQ